MRSAQREGLLIGNICLFGGQSRLMRSLPKADRMSRRNHSLSAVGSSLRSRPNDALDHLTGRMTRSWKATQPMTATQCHASRSAEGVSLSRNRAETYTISELPSAFHCHETLLPEAIEKAKDMMFECQGRSKTCSQKTSMLHGAIQSKLLVYLGGLIQSCVSRCHHICGEPVKQGAAM